MAMWMAWSAPRTLGWRGWMLLPMLFSPLGERAGASGCRQGYRQLGAQRDFTLGRDWMIYASCEHPEMPRLAIAAGRPAEAAAERPAEPQKSAAPGPVAPGPWAANRGPAAGWSSPPASSLPSALSRQPVDDRGPVEVAVGARVRVWKRDGVAAINLAGTALENGSSGAHIRVRLAPGGKIVRGTVRGPGSVELEAGFPGFSGEGQ